jgi:hypothetical protein
MNKVKYSRYTAGFKLNIIEYAEKHGNRAASCEFTMSEFNVRYWRKQKDALLQTINKFKKEYRGPKSVKFPELEDELLEYVRDLPINGVSVSHKMLHVQSMRDSNKAGH